MTMCRIAIFATLAATIAACQASPVVGPSDVADAASADVTADGSDSADSTGPATADAPTAPDTDTTAGELAPDTATDQAAPADQATAPDTAAVVPQCITATDCPAPAACQVASCTPKGACLYLASADASPCSDGNACTTGDTCGGGACAASGTLLCDDSNPCTADKCNPLAGCINLPTTVTTACDDGNACTTGDTCEAGKCQSGTAICQCATNADCGKLEDGNLCNGTLYCDKAAGVPYTCKLNPATVVVCDAAQDGPCQKNACVPATGACVLDTAPQNTACSDGLPCTAGDYCELGQCKGGTNVCFCKADADCKSQEDGDACNGTLFCNKAAAACEVNPLTVVKCQTVNDTFCQQNLCNPKDGKCYAIPVHEGKACDDGNACTPNEQCQKGSCSTATNTCECQKDGDCAKLEDGNLCNGTLYCDLAAAKCVVNPATVVHCNTDDDPPCLRDVCNAKTGACEALPLPKNGTACDDGNACTPVDFCQNGACTATANTCECQQDSDCAAKEDGNACNGTLYCDKGKGKCVVNPATVVSCPTAFDDACLTNQCAAKTGVCGMKPASQGNQCPGSNACSAGGWCQLGQCALSATSACACEQDGDCAKFEDGNSCNGTLYCDKAGKQPQCLVNLASLVVCPTVSDTSCAKNTCQPATGNCALAPLNGVCDDGDACTTGDACADGACKKGLPKVCEDNNACTVDACVSGYGCLALPKPQTACDDGVGCTIDSCNPAQGCVHAIAAGNCEDGNACTDDGCDPKLGCSNAANSAPCSDGNACTTGDACKGGKCTFGKTSVCNDDNPCTDDGCDPKSGCTASSNAVACDDGNACTVKDTCKQGSCAGSTGTCDDANPCTDDGCGSGSCVHSANTAACSDGNACTVGDACAGAKCAAGKAKDCDDGDLCTVDGCVATTGLCLSIAASATACDDKEKCTDDVCNSVLGCGHVNAKGPCDDGNACTSGDTCLNGTCSQATAVVCDDKNLCTTDSCDKAKGCVYQLNSAPCDDAIGCTANDKCSNGKCVGIQNCDDGKACTLDQCDFGTLKCTHSDLTNAGPCDDGNKCTEQEFCAAGACTSLTPVNCDDGNLCGDDTCEKTVGCKHTPNSLPCDNGDCVVGTFCVAGSCVSGKDPKLLQVSFDLSNSFHDRATTAIQTADGYLVAGTRSISDDEVTDGWIVKLKADGTVKAAAKLPNVAPARPAGLYAKEDGTYLLFGSAPLSNQTAAGPALWHLDGEGKVLDKVLVPTPSQGTQDLVLGVCALKDSTQHLLVGRRIVNAAVNNADAILGYMYENGDLYTGAIAVQSEAGAQEARGCLASSAYGLTAVGVSNGPGTAGGRDLQVVRWGGGDGALWAASAQFAGTSQDDWGNAIADVGGGYVVAAGGTDSGGTGGDAFAVMIEGQSVPGKVLWTKTWGGPQKDEVFHLLPAGEGGVFAIGMTTAQNIQHAVIWRLSADGRLVWTNQWASTVSQGLTNGMMLGDGGMLLVGQAKPATNQDFLVARTDFMGNPTCKDSGGCHALLACLDQNNCTDDTCIGTSGCKHLANTDSCNDDNACTVKESCAGGKCASSQSLACDDKNPCTTDSCNPEFGCDAEALPDGFKCGTNKTCTSGTCQ